MDKKEALKLIESALTECEIKCDGPHLVVLDNGWIFHGNLLPDDDGETYRLTSCVNVRRWESVGFGGLTKGAKHANAVLDASEPIRFKDRRVVFSVPTCGNWRGK